MSLGSKRPLPRSDETSAAVLAAPPRRQQRPAFLADRALRLNGSRRPAPLRDRARLTWVFSEGLGQQCSGIDRALGFKGCRCW
jgi:hypothetical protein